MKNLKFMISSLKNKISKFRVRLSRKYSTRKITPKIFHRSINTSSKSTKMMNNNGRTKRSCILYQTKKDSKNKTKPLIWSKTTKLLLKLNKRLQKNLEAKIFRIKALNSILYTTIKTMLIWKMEKKRVNKEYKIIGMKICLIKIRKQSSLKFMSIMTVH